MTFLVIANFKSNKTTPEVQSWLQEIGEVAASTPSLEIVVAPSFPHLLLAISHKPLTFCAQDVSSFPPGSYTGAVNATQLKELGVKYVIIGHSERRRYFHESHQEIANKAQELVSVGLTPVLCLDKGDISGQFAALEVDKAKLVFAYEPAGDIGGTATAPIEDIKAVISDIRQLVGGARVLYGGSVNAENVAQLKGVADGTLVASASLNPNSFISLIDAAK